MRFKEIQKRALQNLGNLILPNLITVLCRSVKIEIVNRDDSTEIINPKQQYVVAFWHGKMLIPWFVFGKKNFASLVSKSKDGEILTRVLKKWHYNVIRGSSHIGGKEALELLYNKVREGFSIAITPDGPTGPARRMKAGAVIVAKKMNIPLILVAVCNKKKKVFSSWDKFEVPLPFSKVYLLVSEPINVKNNLTFDETNLLITRMEEKLINMQKEVERNC